MTVTKQQIGAYMTWVGYGAGAVAVAFTIKHPVEVGFIVAAVVLVFVGRQLEKVTTQH